MDTRLRTAVTTVIAIVAVIAAACVPLAMMARPASADVVGALDPNFGSGGTAATSFLMDQPNARAVAVRPNGKIVVAGQGTAAQHIDFVAQYSQSGAPDLQFGGGDGFVVLNQTIDIESLALQPDGKIIVGGAIGSAYAIQRLNT